MLDNKAPVLKRLVLPSTIDLAMGPQSFTILAEADDGEGGSGIAYVTVSFDRELDLVSGRTLSLLFGDAFSEDGFADGTPTIGTVHETLSDSAPSGTYRITSVSLRDLAGNSVWYGTEQLRALGIGTELVVTGKPLDVIAPVFRNLSLPATIDVSKGPASLPLLVHAGDLGGSGIDEVSVMLSRPLVLMRDGMSSVLRIFNLPNEDNFLDSTPERGMRTFQIDPATAPGEYEVMHLTIKDRAGNWQMYDAAQLRAMGVSSKFTVTGSTADTTAPDLIDLHLPRTVSTQAEAGHGFTVEARDPVGTGVDRVLVIFDRPIHFNGMASSVLGISSLIEGDNFLDATPEFGADSFRFSDLAVPGTYHVESVALWDRAGNHKSYTAAELQARGIDTSMTVLDKAPTATSSSALVDGNLVVSLSSRDWAAAGTDSFAGTLDFDAASLRFVDAVVEGADGIAIETSAVAGANGSLAFKGSGALPAGAVVKIILTPQPGKTGFQYEVKDFVVNGSAQSFALGAVGTVALGTAGADHFGSAQAGHIDAGAGLDHVRFAGLRADYTIRRAGDGFAVEHKSGSQVSLAGVERLDFRDLSVALDADGVGGQAYRLYQAAFDRKPDQGGIGFWMSKLDGGMALATVARTFLASEEFASRYGVQLSDADYVTALYRNVLHRAPDQEGFAFWTGLLASDFDRGELLAFFSESKENLAQVIAAIDTGFAYLPA